MKYINLSYILAGMLTLSMSACSDDDNPSIEDYPLNYEIKEVKATENIAVGCMLVDPYNDLSNATIWERLTNPYNPAEGLIGPNVKPALGPYRLVSRDVKYHDDIATNLGQIAQWAQTAEIDYLITPSVREHNHCYPNNINLDDKAFLELISGHDKTGPWSNDGSLKYAIQLNMQNLASQTGSNNYQTPLENKADITYTDNNETVTITQRERVLNFMRSIAEYFVDDTYYKYMGRPVVFFYQPHEMHTLDISALYSDMRAAMKEISGMDVYIIAEQEPWKPVARYAEVVLDGKPDAVMPREMTNIGGSLYERLYKFGVFLNENFKLNKQFLNGSYPGMEYIPSVSAGYSAYLNNGNVQNPDILPSVDGFRERCWVAKMNLPANPMVVIDAFNNWRYGNAIEPTDPEYGNGWGETYLDIVRQEFKVSR